MPKYPRKEVTEEEEPYCPSTMKRFTDTPSLGNQPIWMCKLCTRIILSEEAVRRHVLICKTQYISSVQPPPTPTINSENTGYSCKLCRKVFSRRVALKYHEEWHERSESSDDSD